MVRRSYRGDPNEVRVSNWIKPWNEQVKLDAAILGVPFVRASQSGVSGAAAAPNALRDAFIRTTTYSVFEPLGMTASLELWALEGES